MLWRFVLHRKIRNLIGENICDFFNQTRCNLFFPLAVQTDILTYVISSVHIESVQFEVFIGKFLWFFILKIKVNRLKPYLWNIVVITGLFDSWFS